MNLVPGRAGRAGNQFGLVEGVEFNPADVHTAMALIAPQSILPTCVQIFLPTKLCPSRNKKHFPVPSDFWWFSFKHLHPTPTPCP